jgi:hypothetical protein
LTRQLFELSSIPRRRFVLPRPNPTGTSEVLGTAWHKNKHGEFVILWPRNSDQFGRKRRSTVITETELANIRPESLRFLKLPATFDDATQLASSDIDAVLSRDERPGEELELKLSAFRRAAQANLLTFRGSQIFEPAGGFPILAWPSDLYIPGSADFKNYWFIAPPADHRYALAWTTPGSANQASSQTGELFSFAELNPVTNAGQFTDAGVGIFYNPPMTLGVVDLQPHINCSGTLRWFLQTFKLAAGHVDVKAQLILAAWQVIPGGFDLVGWKPFDVSAIRRDQSWGPEEHHFTSSFAGANLSAPFVVQKGRTYLLAVLGRISVTSGLTANAVGQTLFPLDNSQLRAWGAMNCSVTQIDVETKQVYIP